MTTYLGTATSSPVAAGVEGDTTTSSANGVKGTSNTSASAIYGANSSTGAGVNGNNSSGTGGYGIYGSATSATSFGVYGTTDDGIGTSGYASSSGYGVYGKADGVNGLGVVGIQGTGLSNYAGWFSGNVNVTMQLTSGTKDFLIDHPCDPAGKELRHACIESNERRNLYEGMAFADATGGMAIQLPDYVEALNEDFRYQLTAVGAPAPNLHVRSELTNTKFEIAGAVAGQKVCWLISGRRKDALARALPLIVEQAKPANERGFYHHPEAHGHGAEKSIQAARQPSLFNRTSGVAPPTR
jgi:hypothetical protein